VRDPRGDSLSREGPVRTSQRLLLALIAVAGVAVVVRLWPRPTTPLADGARDSTTAAPAAPRPLDGAGLAAPRPKAGAVGPASGGVPTAEPAPGIGIDGRVVEVGSGSSIAGAKIHVRTRQNLNGSDFGPTDAEGRFHLGSLPDDAEVTIEARAAGHVAARVQVNIAKGTPSPSSPVLELAVGGSVTGVVRRPDAGPAAGARVSVVPATTAREPAPDRPDSDEVEENARLVRDFSGEAVPMSGVDTLDLFEAVTGPDGTFRLDGLRLDFAYEIDASAADGTSTSPAREVRLAIGAPSPTVELTLRRGSSIVARLAAPTGFPIPEDAEVRLLRGGEFEGKADADAEHVCRFEAVDPGTVKLLTRARGFEPVIVRVVVAEGETTDVRIPLEPGAAVQGVVVDDAGRPLAGVTVTVAGAAGNETIWNRELRGGQTATTDGQGRFSVGGVARGRVLVVANRETAPPAGRVGTRVPVALDAPVAGVRIVAGRLGGARVSLLTPDRKPFVGEVFVDVRQESGASSGRGERVDGVVEVPPLDDGVYELVLVPAGHAWVRREILVRSGAFVDLGEIVLDPGVDVTGRVLDLMGRPVAGARVDVLEVPTAVMRTDEAGRFTIAHFPREGHVVVFGAEGFASEWIEVVPRADTPLEIRLGHPVTFTGLVRRATGEPVAKTTLVLRRPNQTPRRETRTRADGTTRTSDDYAGSYWIETDEAGRFHETVPPGRWIGYSDFTSDRASPIGEWTFADGETRDIEIVLPGK